jgi:hypothetical protein
MANSSTARRHRAKRTPVVAFAFVAVAATLTASIQVVAASAATGSAANPGIGSKEALSAPNCDPATKRIRLPFYAAPPCVKPWSTGDDNGGATAQGVTKKTIKVVVTNAPLPQGSTPGNIVNQATGQSGTRKNAIIDGNAVLAPVFQTWGRTVEFDFVDTTGTDEASQRADAVTVAAMKPFAVLDYAFVYGGGGGIVFQSALAGKVPVINSFPCCGVIPPSEANAPVVENAAEWTGKALVGGKARWAGDSSLKSKTRTFGIIYPGGDQGVNLADFRTEFAKHGGKIAASASYELSQDASQTAQQLQQQAPTLIAKMKAAGVTTVVNFGDGPRATPALMKAATSQNYFPEWIVTGYGYQDIDVVARLSDQKQMAQAFGLIWFVPYAAGQQDPQKSLFQWYWGPNQGTQSVGANSLLFPLYTGIQLAGPHLTAKTFSAALQKFPPTGGAFDNQVSTLEYSFSRAGKMAPRGSAVGWYSPDTVGPSQIVGTAATAAGKYMYLDGGKRYVHGQFPKGEPKLFDKSNSISQLDAIPASEQTPTYPCNNCPSSGGGPAPSASTS